jgi:hypothetical protein
MDLSSNDYVEISLTAGRLSEKKSHLAKRMAFDIK